MFSVHKMDISVVPANNPKSSQDVAHPGGATPCLLESPQQGSKPETEEPGDNGRGGSWTNSRAPPSGKEGASQRWTRAQFPENRNLDLYVNPPDFPMLATKSN